MITVDELKKMFNVSEDQELAPIFDRKKGAVSVWRKKGVPASIERKARQMMAEQPGPSPTTQDMNGFILIPRYNVEASAGGGSVVAEERIIDRMAFREDWVRVTLGLSPKDLVLISATGDSMEPTLHPGDLLLLDRSIERIKDNAIYAIQVNGTLLIKRVQRRTDGSVIIKSDNAAYETEVLTDSKAEDLRIVGRLVWAGRRF